MVRDVAWTKARTRDAPIRHVAVRCVTVPLAQEQGDPCAPVVSPGDAVRAGDLIARTPAGARFDLRLHSPLTGRVVRLAPVPLPGPATGMAVVIESTRLEEPVCGTVHAPGEQSEDAGAVVAAGSPGRPAAREATPRAGDVAARVREAGIVGLGGAGFPAHVKLELPPGVRVDTVLVNACESEPYLTCDHRTLVERPAEVLDGLDILCVALGARRGAVVTTPAEAALLARLAAHLAAAGPERGLVTVEGPAMIGYEKALIAAVCDRTVPRGGLPRDVGVSVHNAQTAVAVACAVRRALPLTARVVTVSGGAVARPGNFCVAIGTPIGALLSECGWDRHRTAALVVGGPLMGVAVDDVATPVRKGTGGVLALTADDIARQAPAPCIRCGSCIDACPVRLAPLEVERLAAPSIPRLAALSVDLCVECAGCESACPSGRPLLAIMGDARRRLAAARRRTG
jgi:electron transport complex protein RnfC